MVTPRTLGISLPQLRIAFAACVALFLVGCGRPTADQLRERLRTLSDVPVEELTATSAEAMGSLIGAGTPDAARDHFGARVWTYHLSGGTVEVLVAKSDEGRWVLMRTAGKAEFRE